MELEEEFKGEKCIAYMEKALAISSSSHKKTGQEKIKQLQLLNNDLKRDLKLKEIMPENSQALDPIFNLIDKKDPTLQDYIDKRKSLLNDEIHKSRSQKRSYGKFNSRLRKSYALSCGYNAGIWTWDWWWRWLIITLTIINSIFCNSTKICYDYKLYWFYW